MNEVPEDLYLTFDRDGYLLLSEVFESVEICAARDSVAKALATGDDSVMAIGKSVYAARNLTELWPDFRQWAFHPRLNDAISHFVGEKLGLVRAIFFDKNPDSPWGLPWHQDLAIAVKSHGNVPEGFSVPTTKRGVPHYEAPGSLLSRMITARIHLDDANESNGALEVIAGSHRRGKRGLSQSDDGVTGTLLNCKAGDVLLMSPLLYHRSAKPNNSVHAHRRVLHFEFAPDHALPSGLEWYEFHSLK